MAVRNDFTAGEVLAAADLNDTFASKADYASGGSDGDALIKSGTTTAWGAVGGLVLVASDTITASSSVSFDNCFTSAYDNYRIMFIFTLSSSGGVSFRFRASASDNTASNYNRQSLTGSGATASGVQSLGQTSFAFPPDTGVADSRSAIIYDVFSPALSEQTAGVAFLNAGQQSIVQMSVLGHTSTTAFDGFSIFRASGTFTGRVHVYGYRKA
jgi:hypothetical protein